jgi:AcrR family transcriptional regulator
MTGLRERKKQQTRQLLAETAWRLFAEHGFAGVAVADVARAADVSEATVFNYFRTKEDLFYSRFEAFEAQLVAAVRDRPAGEPAIKAFRRFLLRPGGLLKLAEAGDADALAQLRTVNRLIADSPALQARERQAFAQTAQSLARLLAEEAGKATDDVTATVVAHALLGVHRALIDHVRRRVLADEPLTGLTTELQRLGRRALTTLERGLADYPPGRR